MPSTPILIGAGRTDRGLARPRNEDAFTLDIEEGVGVVADGLGGHPGGDVASAIAVHVTAAALVEALDTLAPLPDHHGVGMRDAAMAEALLRAHEAILARGRAEPSLRGMGSTTTALIVEPRRGRYSLAHVGDSRAYRLRDGRLDRLTRDDTWVQARVEAGELRAEEAERHPMRHVLTQCLGLEPAPRPAVDTGAARAGDVFLLCTDGLVACLTEADVARVLERALDDREAGIHRAVDALIEEGNRAGGVDNITVLLMTLGPPDFTRPPPPAG